jgi:hypothetical protein
MLSISSPLSTGAMPSTPGDFVALMQGLCAQSQSIMTAGAGTLTAAALMAGFITRAGPTAAFTDTTDTAANILSALAVNPNAIPEYGQTFLMVYVNLSAYAATIAAGTGVTLSGTMTVPANGIRFLLGTVTGPTTVSIGSLFALSGATA